MKIGILGGTFNPVHLGHIKLAEEASRKLELDKVIFVPSYIPPHKNNSAIIPPEDRYKMVELALDKRTDFEVSCIEIELKGTSYSVNTVREFKRIYGRDVSMYFIAGSDYLGELEAWRDIKTLKMLCTLVIATRPGYNSLPPSPHTKIINVDTPDISSTEIRRRIREKIPYKDLVPQKVYDYIITRRLYL